MSREGHVTIVQQHLARRRWLVRLGVLLLLLILLAGLVAVVLGAVAWVRFSSSGTPSMPTSRNISNTAPSDRAAGCRTAFESRFRRLCQLDRPGAMRSSGDDAALNNEEKIGA